MDVLQVARHYGCSAGWTTLWMFCRLEYTMDVLQVTVRYGCSVGSTTLWMFCRLDYIMELTHLLKQASD